MLNRELEQLKELLERLQSTKGTIFVVEGQKDVAALRALNIDADFFLLSRSKRSLYESAEVISKRYNRAILMLDQDQKGKELTKRMVNYLQRLGVHVNTKYARTLLNITRSSTIEGITLE